MRMTRAFIAAGAIAVATSAGLAASTVSATPASSGQPARHGELFGSNLVGRPSDPNLAIAIDGVAPGGVPWALSRGVTRLDASGRLTAEVDGLVITGTGSNLDGTTGPVHAIVASLACEGTAPTLVSTAPVSLSPDGDARIDQQVALPALCVAPIVLVRANTNSGPWIAATGF